jgi:hypothetical protein
MNKTPRCCRALSEVLLSESAAANLRGRVHPSHAYFAYTAGLRHHSRTNDFKTDASQLGDKLALYSYN